VKTAIYRSDIYVSPASDSPYAAFAKVTVHMRTHHLTPQLGGFAGAAAAASSSQRLSGAHASAAALRPQATKAAQENDLEGVAKGKALDVNVFARRCVKALLRRRPPANYFDGYMWRVSYWLGCFGPCWLQLLVHRIRLGY
jgi:hypothetical protein